MASVMTVEVSFIGLLNYKTKKNTTKRDIVKVTPLSKKSAHIII